MTAKTVGFAIAAQDRAQLDELVDYFGQGNRSQFLRAAMKRMKHEMWSEKMRAIQTQARSELGGRVVSPDEVQALVKQSLQANV